MVSGLERLLSAKSGHLSDATVAKLMPVFQEIASMDYQLNETTFEQLADSETWAHRIVAAVRSFSAALEAVFVPDNHSEVTRSLLRKEKRLYRVVQILNRVLQSFVSRCEAYFMQKTFNQLGGLQFDKDIRLLLSHFSEIYQSSVRERFARLTQMATILCFESVEEMLDYWGDEGESINWRLSPAEIKTILKLRNDFSEANISALLL